MSTKTICDRCGKELQSKLNIKTLHLGRMYETAEDLDLCENCFAVVKEFAKGWNDKEKEETKINYFQKVMDKLTSLRESNIEPKCIMVNCEKFYAFHSSMAKSICCSVGSPTGSVSVIDIPILTGNSDMKDDFVVGV